MVDEADLIRVRRELFELFCTIQSPQQAAAFQRELAKALVTTQQQRAEARKQKNKSDAADLGEQIQILRTYGDAIAWQSLHRHAIRQLRKHEAPPANISNQQDSFNSALELVELIAETGTLAIACDVTNCLHLGDVIVADDPEAPTIVECKQTLPKDGELLLGRKGRQLNKLLGTADYLRDGTASLHDEALPRLCIEATKVCVPHWTHVEEVVRRSMAGESAFVEAEPGQVLWARGEDNSDELPDAMKSALRGYRILAVGLHSRFQEDDAPHMAPPLAWPLPQEQQWALSECKVQIATLLDVGQFEICASKRGRIMRACSNPPCFKVETDLGELILSPQFVDDCLYSYYGIDDTVELMLEFVDNSVRLMANSPPPDDAPPPEPPGNERSTEPKRIRTVHSEADVDALIGRGGIGASDVVMADTEIWSKLMGDSGKGRLSKLMFWSPKKKSDDDK